MDPTRILIGQPETWHKGAEKIGGRRVAWWLLRRFFFGNGTACTDNKRLFTFFSASLSSNCNQSTLIISTPLSLSRPNLVQMSAGAAPASTGTVSVDAIKQIAEPKDPKKLSGVSLYSRFAFAGAVCCSVTHGALTPVDV